MRIKKDCIVCGKELTNTSHYSDKEWNKVRKYCSMICFGVKIRKTFNEYYTKDEVIHVKATGKEALFDLKDFDLISNHRWWIASHGYLTANVGGGDRKSLLAHWAIMGKPSKGLEIDHINRNKLDNRRCNLRVVTRSDNLRNKEYKNLSTGIRGVIMRKEKCIKKYRAYFYGENKKLIRLGNFPTLEEAVTARKLAEIKYSK